MSKGERKMVTKIETKVAKKNNQKETKKRPRREEDRSLCLESRGGGEGKKQVGGFGEPSKRGSQSFYLGGDGECREEGVGWMDEA